jgi:hypothetical protein
MPGVGNREHDSAGSLWSCAVLGAAEVVVEADLPVTVMDRTNVELVCQCHVVSGIEVRCDGIEDLNVVTVEDRVSQHVKVCGLFDVSHQEPAP